MTRFQESTKRKDTNNSMVKYLKGLKLTKKEKSEVMFSILYALGEVNTVHYDIIEDWFVESLHKRNEDLLRFVSDYSVSALTSFLNIIKSEDEFEFIHHEDIFSFYNSFETKEELLKVLQITPRKIDDLLVSIDFNLDKHEHFFDFYLLNSKICFDNDKLKSNLIDIREKIELAIN